MAASRLLLLSSALVFLQPHAAPAQDIQAGALPQLAPAARGLPPLSILNTHPVDIVEETLPPVPDETVTPAPSEDEAVVTVQTSAEDTPPEPQGNNETAEATPSPEEETAPPQTEADAGRDATAPMAPLQEDGQDPFMPPVPALPLPTMELTLEDAIALAIKNSPEREIASQQVEQAVASIDEARASYWPQANMRLEEGREYNDPFAVRQGATQFDGYNYGRSANMNVRQMLYDGFITRETVRQRMQLVESAQLSRKKINEELVKTTADVYMEVRQFQQVLVAAADNLNALREIAHLIELRVAAGDASQAEQNYMAARLANAEQQYINAQSGLSDAFSALTYLIGDVPEFSARIPDMEQYTIITPQELLEKAPKANTDARLIASDMEAAEHELEATKGRFHPTLDIVADGTKSDDLGGQTGIRQNGSIRLQLNFKILDGGLRKATTQRQQAKIRELDARSARIRREIIQTVRKSYNNLRTTLEQLKITDNEIVANTELEKLQRKQFELGDIDITLLVESQERIFAAWTKKARLESEQVNATFEILRATADLLPQFCGKASPC